MLTLLCAATAAHAQKSTASPYSIFGYGTLANKEDAVSTGMGHSGVALAPNSWLNSKNPAAYGNLDSLSFYFNLQFKGFYGNEETRKYSQSTYSANIDAIAMGFRVTRWWGAGLGFSPYSHVGYRIDEVRGVIGSNDTYTLIHEGSGGLSQAYINNAFTPLRGLTLGISTSVIWGAIKRRETASITYGEVIYNDKKYTVNNMLFEYGLQYGLNIGKTHLRIGGVYNAKTRLEAAYDQNVSNNVDGDLFHDDESRVGKFYVPQAFTAGIAALRGNWTLAADYKWYQWSDVRNGKTTESIEFRDCWSVGAGAHYAPGRVDDSYFKRLKYSFGGYYATNYFKVKGVELDNYSITAGISFPVRKWGDYINVSYEFNHGGTTSNSLIKETYHNFKIGLNIREIWFMKSQFD